MTGSRALLIGIKDGLESRWSELRNVEIAVAEVPHGDRCRTATRDRRLTFASP